MLDIILHYRVLLTVIYDNDIGICLLLGNLSGCLRYLCNFILISLLISLVKDHFSCNLTVINSVVLLVNYKLLIWDIALKSPSCPFEKYSVVVSKVAVLTHIASNWLNCGMEAKRMGTSHPSLVPYQVRTLQVFDGNGIFRMVKYSWNYINRDTFICSLHNSEVRCASWFE